MMSELLTGEEEVVYGDSGYLGAEKREEAIVKNYSGKLIKYKGTSKNRCEKQKWAGCARF